MTFDEALEVARRNPGDPDAVEALADIALDSDEEEAALPLVSAATVRFPSNARIWQWLGLLHRALDDRRAAIPAFDTAMRLAPQDAGIAHSRARVALEAGLPAVDLFEAASRLAPSDGAVLLGRGAAHLAEGNGAQAVEDLARLLRANPLWLEGHADLAQLRWIMGDREGFLASIEVALVQAPRAAALWQLLVHKLIDAGDFGGTLAAVAKARMFLGEQPFLVAADAVAHSETGAVGLADACFTRLDQVSDISLAVRRIRHQLRTGRLGQALVEIDKWTGDPAANFVWPYAAIAWRIAGDPRLQWLEGDAALVSVMDLSDSLPPLDRLAPVLQTLHHSNTEQFDQSVRGGTQTEGVLFQRIEPEICALRAAIAQAVERHIQQLPPVAPGHPVLGRRRDRPIRFSGSWSVRLEGEGFHANHIHPAGWLSSALYVALPPSLGEGDGRAGWLALGEPQSELGLGIGPTRFIEPKPGRLVVFPSTMWHGTLPFVHGERLTVAFDVRPPTPR